MSNDSGEEEDREDAPTVLATVGQPNEPQHLGLPDVLNAPPSTHHVGVNLNLGSRNPEHAALERLSGDQVFELARLQQEQNARIVANSHDHLQKQLVNEHDLACKEHELRVRDADREDADARRVWSLIYGFLAVLVVVFVTVAVVKDVKSAMDVCQWLVGLAGAAGLGAFGKGALSRGSRKRPEADDDTDDDTR